MKHGNFGNITFPVDAPICGLQSQALKDLTSYLIPVVYEVYFNMHIVLGPP